MKEPFLSDSAFLADVREVKRRAGTVDLWWLGQSGFLVHHRNRWIVIDPYLSDSLTKKYASTDKPHVRVSRRVVDPARLGGAITPWVTVTSSHAHTDHLDPETLAPLIDNAFVDKIIFPKAALAETAARSATRNSERREARGDTLGGMPTLEPKNPGVAGQVGPGIKVTAIASAHEQVELDEAGNCKYLGYVFEFSPSVIMGKQAWIDEKELTIYHSGDTMLYDGLVEKLKPFNVDIALFPINGRAPERRVAGNLNGREAAWLAKEIGARLVIPCHYDMFEFNTADPYAEFVPECERLGQPYRVLRLGERFSSSEL